MSNSENIGRDLIRLKYCVQNIMFLLSYILFIIRYLIPNDHISFLYPIISAVNAIYRSSPKTQWCPPLKNFSFSIMTFVSWPIWLIVKLVKKHDRIQRWMYTKVKKLPGTYNIVDSCVTTSTFCARYKTLWSSNYPAVWADIPIFWELLSFYLRFII